MKRTLSLAATIPFEVICLLALVTIATPNVAFATTKAANADARAKEMSGPHSLVDSCEPIRKAIRDLPEGGGEVRIRNGYYVCATPVVLDRDNVTVRGEKGAVLRLADGANAPLIVMGDIATPPRHVRNVTVADLELDGNKDHQEIECWGGPCDSGGTSFIRNNGITVRGISDGRIENVITRNARSGGVVTEKGCYNLVIDGLTSVENYFDGFAGYETYGAVLKNMVLSNNHAAGISIDIRFIGNRIQNTEIKGNGDVGIFMRDSNANRFEDVVIDGNRNHGIFLSHVKDDSTCANDNEFFNLKVRNSKGAGFRLNNACTGNRLTGATEFKGNRDGCISEGTDVRLGVHGHITCEN